MEQILEHLRRLQEGRPDDATQWAEAKKISQREDWRRILCRAVFDPGIVEMEVLPMALGLCSSPNEIYRELEQLPESLTFANLRLRARGLKYIKNVDPVNLERLAERLIEFVARRNSEDDPYGDRIIKSFSKAREEETRAYLVDRLASQLDKAWVGLWAVSAIGVMGGGHALTKLLETLTTGDAGLRMQSAFALSNFESEQAAVDALRRALKNNESAAVRLAAASSLGEIGNPCASGELLAALRADEGIVRWSAAEALRKIEHQVSAALEEDLASEDVRVRSVAAFVLGRTEALIDVLSTRANTLYDRARAASALGTTKAEAAVGALLEALLEQLDMRTLEGHIDLRRSATSALGEIGRDAAIGRSAIEALLRGLRAEDNDIRWPAAWELGKIGNDLAVPGLITALNDTEYRGARWRAAEALGKIGGDSAKNALHAALDDEDHFVSRSAALALARLGIDDVRVVEECFKAIRDSSSLVRWRAAEALGRVGGPPAVPPLLEALQDDMEVRDPAARSLELISASDLAEGLLLALDYNSDFVRRKAAQVIEYYDSGEHVLRKLRDLATNDSVEEAVRAAAVDAQRKIEFKLALCGS